jgi:hypothetical protein
MIQKQERCYIRHVAHIPLEVEPYDAKHQVRLRLKNVSVGGLAFKSPEDIPAGTLVKIRISTINPEFLVDGIVQWCKPSADDYEVGVEFLGEEDAFRVRMMEQVCHIEEYLQKQLKLGRTLSINEASEEWIEKHGASFPR